MFGKTGNGRPAWLESPTLPEAERAGLEAAQALVEASEADWIEGPMDYTGAGVFDYTREAGS